MSDFHRSLDRALEHEPHWAIEHTTAFDDFDPRPLPDSWQDLGYMDETGVGNDLLAIQAKINRDIAALAAVTLAPALFEERRVPERGPYDIRWKDPEPQSMLWRSEEWEAYVARLVEETGVDLEKPHRYWVQRWVCGVDTRPALADQEIPAEGTE